ncbi:MAG: CpaF family protein [Azospirillaceae bacterium]
MKPQAISEALTPFEVTDRYQTLKFRVFGAVLERLERRNISADEIEPALLEREIEATIPIALAAEATPLNAGEKRKLIADVRAEIVGFGPIDPLLDDETIDDIVVNGPNRVYVERRGQLEPVAVRFRDNAHVMNIIYRIIGPIGRRVDENNPFVDARLPDGSRVNAMIPPVAIDGPTLSIRKFKRDPLSAQDLLDGKALNPEMLSLLRRSVRGRMNILIIGGTGAGKTTLLNVLSGFMGAKERVITIEDAAELQIRHAHVVRAETRPGNADGAREVSSREILRNALRMRPDRIILGEVRGSEAVDMLQAMSTGHPGSMATIHANSTRDALARLEMLLGFADFKADPATMRRFVSTSIDMVVEVQRLASGVRRIVGIGMVRGADAAGYAIEDAFRFREDPPLSGEGTFERIPEVADALDRRLPRDG